ncbi:MAG: glycosyl transferase family 4 [Gammaproteobacteria bacterium]|nr:glycosyl transferase family 4 [Gammaproteobacteria bacterium]
MVPDAALIALFVGFLSAVVLEVIVIGCAQRFQLYALPNARSFHDVPTPGIGGMAFVIPIIIYLIAVDIAHDGASLASGLWPALTLVAAIGLWDDLSELSARVRFSCHWIAVAFVLWYVDPTWHWAVVGVIAFAIVWHINLFNFMDGIDGIAAVQCLLFCVSVQVLAGGVAGWQGDLLWLTVGGTLGFLIYNWPPARIFMGDVGSGFLGLLLGLLTVELWKSETLPLIACLTLLAGFWFDATYTLCVRMMTGQAFTEAHRSHLYQLVAERKGHLWTTVAYTVFGIVWLLPLAWLELRFPAVSFFCLTLAVLPLAVLAVRLRVGLRATPLETSTHKDRNNF